MASGYGSIYRVVYDDVLGLVRLRFQFLSPADGLVVRGCPRAQRRSVHHAVVGVLLLLLLHDVVGVGQGHVLEEVSALVQQGRRLLDADVDAVDLRVVV